MTALLAHVSLILMGSLALLCSGLVLAITTAMGPDVRVFPCLDARGRMISNVVAFWWFVRGISILTTGDPTHQHWDSVFSWGSTAVLAGHVLAYVWSQRMPPGVRDRFDRREAFKRDVVQGLLADGRTAEAERAAEGTTLGMQQAYELGLSPSTAVRLRDAP